MSGGREAGTLVVLAGPEELARAGAAAVLGAARAAVEDRGSFFLALAGGTTPRRLYEVLAGDHRADFPWARTHFFWSDERHVAPDHPRSNHGMAWRAMLAAAAVPAENIHRFHTEDPDAERVAAAYERDVREVLGRHERVESGVPRLDLVLLGLGADGHTASLFPGATPGAGDALVEAPWVETLAARRLTFTLRLINAAREVRFVVSGADKAGALARARGEDPAVGDVPARLVRPHPGRLVWMADREAAGLPPGAAG